jgi:protease I
VTSYKSIKTDVINAGGQWVDEQVVSDKGLITSRQPDDLDAFSAKIIEEIKKDKRERRIAA